MATQEPKSVLRILELTERLMSDAELRPAATQSGSSSSSGGIGGASSSTSGSALANLTASLIGAVPQVKLDAVQAGRPG
jgi:hypothetical protein